MQVALGVFLASTSVHAVFVDGDHADGFVDIDVPDGDEAVAHVVPALEQVRADAAGADNEVTSTGIAWVDAADVAALRRQLAAHDVENVVLVSALSAAAALARAFGGAAHYAHTALLYVEPSSATLAVIYTPDGSVLDLRQRALPGDDDAAVAGLLEMVTSAGELEPRPEGVYVVGSGVDLAMITPALTEATSLPLSVADEPQRALARGAALVSASTPLVSPAAAAVARRYAYDARFACAAVLFVEPQSATLSVVRTAEGSAARVRQRFLPDDDDAALAVLADMLRGAEEEQPRPEGVLLVGPGVDVSPALQAATSLPLTTQQQARGARTENASAAQGYGSPVLEARSLCKSFGRESARTQILSDINLEIFPGEFVALIGPSGSGKSTLLSILGLLEPPSSGELLVNQRSVAQLSAKELAAIRGRQIGYVFQSFNLLGGLSVAENVMLPALLAGESGHAQHGRAVELLDQFGLAGSAKRVPAELSGGEQQRVAIARALFMSPDVILADEPTGNLDTANGRIVIDTLYRLNAGGQTIVLVTHDLSIADEAPRVISFLDGRINTDSGPIHPNRNAAWRGSR